MHPTQATTECYQQNFDFQELGSRRVVADFTGGHLSSDGGCLLLRETDRSSGLCAKLARCFSDFRDALSVEHELPVMLRQRIMGIALGYEDINDHDQLRLDPLLAAMCGRADLLGQERHLTQDQGKGLAGKSTLNRLELGAHETNVRTKKIQAHAEQIEALLLREGVRAIPRKSEVIVLDFDATDDPIHGAQEGRLLTRARRPSRAPCGCSFVASVSLRSAPRLLRRLLLPAALLFLRRHPALGAIAHLRSRRQRWHARGAAKDHRRHPRALWQRREDHRARRQRLLQRAAHELDRSPARRALCAGPGAQ